MLHTPASVSYHARALGRGALAVTLLACGGPNPVAPPNGPPHTDIHLVFRVPPSDGMAGAPLTPPVQVAFTNAQGDVLTVVQDVTVQLDANPGSSTLSGTVTVTSAYGIATFDDLALDKAAPGYTLVATSGSLTSPSSPEFEIAAGAPAQLGFSTQPSDTDVDLVVQPGVAVSIQDDQGNVVPTSTAPVTIAIGANPAGATLAGALTVDAVNGVATFTDLTLDEMGSGYTLTGQSPNLSPATSAPFSVVLTFRQMTLGASHTCGVTTSGSAYCWGYNNYGQLGDGNLRVDTDIPVRVRGGHMFESLAAGGQHTCGVTTSGAAYCWGDNLAGKLGDGNAYTNRDTPVAVLGGHTFASLAAAGTHTCGVTTDSAAYCWGYDGHGQLGDPNTGNEIDRPVLVDGGHSFVSLAVGDTHTCGITTAGDIYCWGGNFAGALGDGNAGTDSDAPVLVEGGHAFVSLAAGGEHTCGITTGGDAYCWGANYSSQLGDGNGGTNSDTAVLVQGGHTFARIAEAGAENGHACAPTAAGVAYCWGENSDGQLGDNTTGTERGSPVMVAGGHTFASLATGGSHTCGVTNAGVAYCWGSNSSGQLGDGGTGTDQSAPVVVISGKM